MTTTTLPNKMTDYIVHKDDQIISREDIGMKYVLYPKTVAVVGASERANSVGLNIMENLVSGNSKKKNMEIFPINPKSETICGKKVYKSVKDCPVAIEHVVIVIPAKFVPGVVEECGLAGVKCITVISAGFKEVGAEGEALELKVVELCKKYNMRCIGPNCLGVMTPNYGMNATFAARMALEGNIAFISQSGAMCTAALDWSVQKKVGFSAFVSIGSMADVEWADLISYLGDDADTNAILIYMESVGDAKKFMSACRAVTPKKPIIVIKAGKSNVAAEAAASHTGSLAGSYSSFIAAMARCGVLAVDSIRELFDCAIVVDKMPTPLGPNLTIVTNAGGPGVLATDACCTNDCHMVELDELTVKQLDAFLPAAWSKANPVDILGDAKADIYAKTLEICLKDPKSDGVLVILSPQSTTEPLETAKAVVKSVQSLRAQGITKTIITSWMGGIDVEEAFTYLNKNGVPCIDCPDDAAKTFAYLYKQKQALTLNSEQPKFTSSIKLGDTEEAMRILRTAQDKGQAVLSEYESKVVMKGFGVPIVETIVATSREAAGAATKDTLFPAVIKLHSDTITHKSDVGGVILNVKSVEEAMSSYDKIKENCFFHTKDEANFLGVTVQPMLDLSKAIELLAGAVSDAQFGPLVVFGSGGCMVEVVEDTATGIPPLGPINAKALVSRTKISKALYGTGTARFPGCSMDDIYQCLINFSNMVGMIQEFVNEIEINPLLAFSDRVVAVDARICIRPKNEEFVDVIIRPYPAEYETKFEDHNGKSYFFKILDTVDLENYEVFLSRTSDEDFHRRFWGYSRAEVSEKRYEKCNPDFSKDLPLVLYNDNNEILAICRITKNFNDETRGTFRYLDISKGEDKKGLNKLTEKCFHELKKLRLLSNSPIWILTFV